MKRLISKISLGLVFLLSSVPLFGRMCGLLTDQAHPIVVENYTNRLIWVRLDSQEYLFGRCPAMGGCNSGLLYPHGSLEYCVPTRVEKTAKFSLTVISTYPQSSPPRILPFVGCEPDKSSVLC